MSPMFSARNLFHRKLPAFLTGLVLASVLNSCQSVSNPDPGTSSQPQYRATIPRITNESRIPEKATWEADGKTGTRALAKGDLVVPIGLDNPPKDTVWVGLWRAGVQYYRLAYRYEGNENLKFLKDFPDEIALTVLKTIHPSTSDSAFRREFARLLVANDPLVKDLGFPKQGLTGVSSDLVLAEAMKIIAEKRLPLADIVPATGSWALGLDSNSIRSRIRDQVSNNSLEADTSLLFRAPIVVAAPVKLGGSLVAGEGKIFLTGKLESSQGIIGASIRVLRDEEDVTSKFEIPTILLFDRPTVLDLADQKCALGATGVVPAGEYRLEIVAQDELKRVLRVELVFTVTAAPDETAPVILAANDSTRNQTVPFSVGEIGLAWKVTDNKSVDSVWIDGKLSAGENAIYSSKASLKVGVNEIEIRAIDKARNTSVAKLEITRKADVNRIAPEIVPEAGTKTQTVPYTTDKLTVSWKVTDDESLAWVEIQGNAIEGQSDLFSAEVPLKVGANDVVVQAQDEVGNKSTQKIVVTREAYRDPNAPVIVAEAGTKTQTVPYATDKLTVSWKVTDDENLASVEIQGKVIEGQTGIFSEEVPLKEGINDIVVVARDATGNKSTQTIVVTREAYRDPNAPVIVAEAGTKTQTVPYTTDKVTVSWKVTDDESVASVEILGNVIEGQSGIFSEEVPLKVGTNDIVIQAFDATGNKSTQKIVVTREAYRDPNAPVIAAEAGTKTQTVPYATDKVTVSWKVTDDEGVSSVLIKGVAVTGNQDVYSLGVALLVGENPIVVEASDAAGNKVTDKIVVTREAYRDPNAPVIVAEAGTKTQTVAYATDKLTVSWKVTDDESLASVEIQGKVIEGQSGIFSDEAPLKVGTNDIVIQAMDATGNKSTETIVVTREAYRDPNPPVIVAEAGTKTQTVAYATDKLTVSWKVTDDESLASVEIQGKVIEGQLGIFSEEVPLDVGTNDIVIEALDATGNKSTETIVVTREAYRDPNPPVIVAEAGTKTQTVAYATDKLTVSWKVTDDEKVASVQINGVAVTGIQGVYSLSMALVVGDNPVVVEAADPTGNKATAKIVVTRAKMLNTAPIFTKGADVSVLEDAGLVKVASWAIGIKPGTQIEEADQVLSFVVTTTEPTLFQVAPAITPTGDLSFTPAANAFGKAVVTVKLQDDGGTANGGVNVSAAQTFGITIAPVNEPPSFKSTLAAITVKNYEGLKTYSGWATAISGGPGGEAAVDGFEVTVPTAAQDLFETLPQVDKNGTLTFQTKRNVKTDAPIVATVVAHDPDGTANGGVDRSSPVSLSISIEDEVMVGEKAYKFKTLGNQVWMLENMGGNTSWSEALGLPTECNDIICAERIQNPMQGVCPVGWHVPTSAEWTKLIEFAAGSDDAAAGATRLKSTEGYCHYSTSTNTETCTPGTDDFGFNLVANTGTGGPGFSVSFSRMWIPEENSDIYGTSLTSAINFGRERKASSGAVRCMLNQAP
ncbi:MAG: cadherin-like beta sandwich domain-containing protein [Fibrobacteria bacterium]|nr:cadherin-like beta sandwich domain-containing protein [Fibrobacteria bacterium]